jgi:dynein heavy chain, axonemal
MKKVLPKRVPTQDNLYDFFISRARANLHVVLCFSPVGEKFRNRSLKFPGLISGCTVDWFQKWPKDALIAVSRHFLQDFPIVCTADVKKGIIELMAFVQEIVSNFCNEYFERYIQFLPLFSFIFEGFIFKKLLKIQKTTESS